MILAAITTCRRKPAMVERALRSVIAQTYTDWECVVVDDSPADYELRGDVRRMVEGYAAQDSRIRYVPHDGNRGVSAARNTALKIAISTDGGGGHEFIAYLDDDDEWLPEKLEKQVKRMRECSDNTALIYCDICYINEDTGVKKFSNCAYSPERQGYVYEKLLPENFIANCGLIRTKYLERIGGFDETMSTTEDWDMVIRLAKYYEFYFVAEPLLIVYRRTNENHVNKLSIETVRALEMISERNLDYLREHKDLYWTRTTECMYVYGLYGEYRNCFKAWLRLISLKPLRIWANTKKGIKYLIVFPAKKWLRRTNPELFQKLKTIKRKLKGDTEIDTN